MFEIGFLEFVVVSVIGLIVIGPERLPRVAYSIGIWFGKLQRVIREAQSELKREFDTEEYRQMIEKQEAEIRNLKNILTNVEADAAVDDLLGDVKELNRDTQQNPEKHSD